MSDDFCGRIAIDVFGRPVPSSDGSIQPADNDRFSRKLKDIRDVGLEQLTVYRSIFLWQKSLPKILRSIKCMLFGIGRLSRGNQIADSRIRQGVPGFVE